MVHDVAQDVVLVENHGLVRVLTLNRPQRRNAIDLELRRVLAERLEVAMTDDTVRVIVLTGAGGTFCSGGDITTMRRQTEAETRPRAQAAQRVVRAIWEGKKPVVACVEGIAYGAGVALALACDRIVAATNAVFNTTFTRVGLAGDMGIFASLPSRIGLTRARQLLMLPQAIHGPEALELGLVDALAEPGNVLAAAITDAEHLAAGPPLALAAIKAMLGNWPQDPREVLDAEVEMQVRLFDTEDFAEGVAAFHEHRTPQFLGH